MRRSRRLRAGIDQLQLSMEIWDIRTAVWPNRAVPWFVARLQHFNARSRGLAVHAFAGTPQELALLVAQGCYIAVSGAQLCAAGAGADVDSPAAQVAAAAREIVRAVPRDRLLLASDSPFGTPQTIEDEYVRELPNQPANLPFVVRAIAAAIGSDEATTARLLFDNALRFFAIPETDEAAAAAAATAPVQAAEAAPAAAPAAAADAEKETKKDTETDMHEEYGEDKDEKKEKEKPLMTPRQQKRQQRRAKQNERHATPESAENDSDENQHRRGGRRQHQELPELFPEKEAVHADDEEDSAEPDVEADGGATEEAKPTAVVTYTCKMCRRTLFAPADVLPHAAAGDARLAGSKSRGDAACSVFFLAAVDWAQAQAKGDAEGKLACPGCAAKIGRYCLTSGNANVLPCTCGKGTPAPAFRVVRARVDRLVSGAVVPADMPADDVAVDADDGDDAPRRKKEKRKKLQRPKHAGNFSQFRNKST
eukprot:TRINITY_DN3232_c0_g1_i2.p1 TRINITY_DN3232_c0_g1~~TRINITY_DN3232_c0_g1_i2.p1  ORF type:complete len:480 (+),score=130.91 TRINITY_DN3232_c0_g1_i2:663-2102(+)